MERLSYLCYIFYISVILLGIALMLRPKFYDIGFIITIVGMVGSIFEVIVDFIQYHICKKNSVKEGRDAE